MALLPILISCEVGLHIFVMTYFTLNIKGEIWKQSLFKSGKYYFVFKSYSCELVITWAVNLQTVCDLIFDRADFHNISAIKQELRGLFNK